MNAYLDFKMKCLAVIFVLFGSKYLIFTLIILTVIIHLLRFNYHAIENISLQIMHTLLFFSSFFSTSLFKT